MERPLAILCTTGYDRIALAALLSKYGFKVDHVYTLYDHVIAYPDKHVSYVYFDVDETRKAYYDRKGVRVVSLAQASILLASSISSVDNLSTLNVQLLIDKVVPEPVLPPPLPPVKLKWWQRAVLTIKKVFSFFRRK